MTITCVDDNKNPNWLTVEQALLQIKTALQPIQGDEQVAIREGLGRILATDTVSPINVPAHNSAMMDGYAIHGEDLSNDEIQLKVVGTAFAGKPHLEPVPKGGCIRIFTGAVLPDELDTVIMQEHVDVQDNTIKINGEQKVGQHIFPIGGDITKGHVALKAGKKLLAAEIGLLASLGIAEIRVQRRLKVAFFSTGDELCSIGSVPQVGQIYDSNRYTLYSMLKQADVEIMDMGVVRDVPEDIEKALLLAAENSDVVITSGGVSVGDADYVVDILKKIGEMDFWKLAVKPGKPLTFGKINNAQFFGLPGNPVSAMNTFYHFVLPALRYLQGQDYTAPFRVKATCLSDLKKRSGRLDFQRGILKANEQGEWVVTSTGQQSSAMLSSMSQANCFIVLPLESGNIKAGTEVIVEPFETLFV